MADRLIYSELDAEAATRGLRVTRGECELYRDGWHYRMTSPTSGEHTLSVACTDTKRLAAHWQGFTSENG